MGDISLQIIGWSKREETNRTESRKGADAKNFKGSCLWDCIKNMAKSKGKKNLTNTQIANAVREIAKYNNIENPNQLKLGQKVKVNDQIITMLGLTNAQADSYSQKAGKMYLEFANNPDAKEFNFIDPEIEFTSADEYFQKAKETSEEILKNYDINNDGTVTPEEMTAKNNQTKAKIKQQRNKTDEQWQQEFKNETKGLSFISLECFYPNGVESYKEKIVKHQGAIKPTSPKFAQNLAKFDGDASSISATDMSVYLIASDYDTNGLIKQFDKNGIATKIERDDKLYSAISTLNHFKETD